MERKKKSFSWDQTFELIGISSFLNQLPYSSGTGKEVACTKDSVYHKADITHCRDKHNPSNVIAYCRGHSVPLRDVLYQVCKFLHAFICLLWVLHLPPTVQKLVRILINHKHLYIQLQAAFKYIAETSPLLFCDCAAHYSAHL